MNLSKNAAANQETEIRAFDLENAINRFAQDVISSKDRNHIPELLRWLQLFSERPLQVSKNAFLSVKSSSMFLTQLYNLLSDAIEWAYIRKLGLLELKLEILGYERDENDKTKISDKHLSALLDYECSYDEKMFSFPYDEAINFHKSVIREVCERLLKIIGAPGTPTTSHSAELTCSICDDEDTFDTVAVVYNCKCQARYHKKCLNDWFKTSKKCPACLRECVRYYVY